MKLNRYYYQYDYRCILLILLLLLLAVCRAKAQGQFRDIRGKVVSAADRTPLRGASVRVPGTGVVVTADSTGDFTIRAGMSDKMLRVTYIGYRDREMAIGHEGRPLLILMEQAPPQLREVTISTGYQRISAERATGSAVQVDNQLLNRRVSTGILDRLEDVTSGLLFNKGRSAGASPVSIRGQNTIYGNAGPLIVLDNFPYDGNLASINPNDVESITVLKDAAAASIWGSRAGNGVIVITTKKARYNQPPVISLNASTTIGAKPGIFYQPRMSSADFIAVERQLFGQGFYENAETGYNNPAITPAAEVLIARRDGQLTPADAEKQLAELAAHDVRDDFKKYFYQASINRQYAVGVNGGGENQRFMLSAGYDHNRDNLVRNGYDRYTLSASQALSFLDKKLEVTAGFYYAQNNTLQNNPGTGLIGLQTGSGLSLYPYARLADAAGNPLAMTHNYRAAFVKGAEQQGLLDWSYRPLAEVRMADNTLQSLDYRLNGALSYKLRPYLSLNLLYQYGRTITDARNLQGAGSYYTRDLVNNFTQVDGSGQLTYGIPLGGILDQGNVTAVSQSLRAQLNFSRNWGEHSLTAIAGYELRDLHTTGSSNRSYGYDDAHAVALPVDYVSLFPQYAIPGFATTVPYFNSLSDLTDRNLSYYANAAYTFRSRYTVSGSARLDRNNLFGVKANQQGVPLYSAGLSWNIDREDFYRLAWLPYLKLRLTYGYNGNVNKSLSAYTTAQYLTGNPINTTYAQVINPPNPELRWERVRVINIGLDFATRDNRLTGSVEPYFKRGLDLIGDIPYAPSSGITTFRGNTASTSGRGLDLTIGAKVLDGVFKWQVNLLFSFVKDKVTGYELQQPAGFYTNFGDSEVLPLSGRPFYALYSYRWAGLDPKTGDPQGYLDGQLSKDYAKILSSATPANLDYNGPARPVTYGAFRNTFAYKQFSVSANISYRLGYYFRSKGIFYNNVLNGQGYDEGLYSRRWQQPGDEVKTTVPSMPAALDDARDSFYNFSSATAEKADNIRLQDISLTYEFAGTVFPRLRLRHLQVYAYANNIGMLWKATKTTFDPDYPAADYRPVRTIALGIRADF